jgi:TctA family transporter
MLQAIYDGLMSVLTVQSILFMAIGALYGLIIGFLPGLGGIVAMALLLPFTYGYEPTAVLSLLLGAHIGTIWGGTVTAILFRVPGSGKNLASVFDGYPMAQNGEATRALSASAVASLMGGIIGAIFLAISIPFVRPVIFALGPSEYLMMALWGLTIIASFSDGSVIKGMIAAAFGILFAFVGMDPVTATPRYTFGFDGLLDGFSFPVAMIGMFAIPEMLKLFVEQKSITTSGVADKPGMVWQGVKDVFIHWGLLIRSSALGVWIGVLPGIGANVGGIAAYAQAVQTSKTPEKFGKGTVEGVIAPDATLGANEGGGLLPTLAFGIPGGEAMAILLVAFISLGITPGPTMLTEHLDVVFGLVWIIILANLLITIVGLAISPYLSKLTRLDPNFIIPIVLIICFVAAYATENRMEDVVVAAGFGILGYFMEKYKYSRATFVIGMVLATMIERNLHLSLTLYGEWFLFTRPITTIMFLLIVFTTAWPFIKKWRKRSRPAVTTR